MDSSTSLYGQVHSLLKGIWYRFLLFFIKEIPVRNANSVDSDQTRFLWRLIRVYTVCQYPFGGTLGIHGLFDCMIQV